MPLGAGIAPFRFRGRGGLIVGGNIDHLTRVMTTAIAMEAGKGDLVLALGLGLVLIAIGLGVNRLVFGLGTTRLGGAWQ